MTERPLQSAPLYADHSETAPVLGGCPPMAQKLLKEYSGKDQQAYLGGLLPLAQIVGYAEYASHLGFYGQIFTEETIPQFFEVFQSPYHLEDVAGQQQPVLKLKAQMVDPLIRGCNTASYRMNSLSRSAKISPSEAQTPDGRLGRQVTRGLSGLAWMFIPGAFSPTTMDDIERKIQEEQADRFGRAAWAFHEMSRKARDPLYPTLLWELYKAAGSVMKDLTLHSSASNLYADLPNEYLKQLEATAPRMLIRD